MTREELLADGLQKVSQVARRLAVSRNTIYEWIKEGAIPYLRLNDTVRIPTRAVDQMIEKGLHMGDHEKHDR